MSNALRIKEKLYSLIKIIKKRELLDSSSWIWIFLCVCFLFGVIPLLGIRIFPLFVDSHDLIEQVDNRTTDIIALISITFAIVGFIIGSLAAKDDLVYKIILRGTLLFPTLYLGLSMIFCFIIFSTIKTSLSVEYVATALLCGLLLIFLFLLLMGRMFKSLIFLMKTSNIRFHVKREFGKEIERYADDKMVIWSRDYFDLKHDRYADFITLAYIRGALQRSIENKDKSEQEYLLDIILYSYIYQQNGFAKKYTLQLYEPQPLIVILNTEVLPEYVENAIKQSVLDSSIDNLEYIKDFILRLQGLGIYGNNGKESFAPHYGKALDLYLSYYIYYESCKLHYNINNSVVDLCKEVVVDYLIGSYKNIKPGYKQEKLSERKGLKDEYYDRLNETFYQFIKYGNVDFFEAGMQELITQLWGEVGYCSVSDIEDALSSSTKIDDEKLCKYEEILQARFLLFRLRYWVHYLEKATNQHVDKSKLFAYNESIDKIFPDEYQELWEFICMYINSYYERKRWDYRDIKSGKAYSTIEEQDWLVSGFVHYLVKGNVYIDFDPNIHARLRLYFGSRYNYSIFADIIRKVRSSLSLHSAAIGEDGKKETGKGRKKGKDKKEEKVSYDYARAISGCDFILENIEK